MKHYAGKLICLICGALKPNGSSTHQFGRSTGGHLSQAACGVHVRERLQCPINIFAERAHENVKWRSRRSKPTPILVSQACGVEIPSYSIREVLSYPLGILLCGQCVWSGLLKQLLTNDVRLDTTSQKV
ncbi:MAG: hypothetical protein IID36_13350 [Planctomycetes bacterium]|nr:hypothetical protein [Planctomycetota bacterium]